MKALTEVSDAKEHQLRAAHDDHHQQEMELRNDINELTSLKSEFKDLKASTAEAKKTHEAALKQVDTALHNSIRECNDSKKQYNQCVMMMAKQ